MKRLAPSFACLLALACVSPAGATTALRLTNQGLTETADVILIGRSEARRSVWAGRQLVTLVTVSVGETLKGTAPASVTVVLPGGIDMQRRVPLAMTWPGAPTLAPQEDVLLFLVGSGEVPDAYTVAGFSQGKFSIVDENGVKSVSHDLSKVDLVGPRGTARGTRSSAPLKHFKDEIRSYLRGRH